MPVNKRIMWFDLFLLTLLMAGFYLAYLGSRPLFVPDEGRYAEIAREMVANNDYITPYLNGIKYFEKPILFYWLEAAVIKVFGLKVFWLRSINWFFGFLCTLVTYCVITRLYNRFVGLMSSIILGTSILFVVMSQMLSLDLLVTVMLTFCLYLFILGASQAQHRTLYLCASAIFAGLAVLTKGLIGIVFPIMIIGIWLTWTRQWHIFRWQTVILCLCLFLAVTVPWHALVGYRNPEFFSFYFIEQHFWRYLDKSVGHYQPVWYFIPILVLGFFPWVFFLPASTKNVFTQNQPKPAIFFLIWGVSIFTFFSFSKSKLIPYILPVFPPFAVLIAYYFDCKRHQPIQSTLKSSAFFLFIFTFFIIYMLFKYPLGDQFPDKSIIQEHVLLACLCLSVGVFCSCYFALTNMNKMFPALIATSALLLPQVLTVLPLLDTRTIYPLAKQLKRNLKPGDEVIAMNHYYQDLPFYLERKVSILNWKNELSFGMRLADTSSWMLNDAAFWRKWHSTQRIYGFINKDKLQTWLQRYPETKYYVYAKGFNTLIITNQQTS